MYSHKNNISIASVLTLKLNFEKLKPAIFNFHYRMTHQLHI